MKLPENRSLDPRINRLNMPEWQDEHLKPHLDQLETYEVFVRTREGRPLQHEGIVHASDPETAFVFAKEQFSRRATCVALSVTPSQCVHMTPFEDNGRNVYEQVEEPTSKDSPANWEIFHLFRRGKQHQHAGTVEAGSPEEAFYEAKEQLDPGNPAKPVLNVWAIRSDDLHSLAEEGSDIWRTTPEKTFREALDYKGAEKIKAYKSAKS